MMEHDADEKAQKMMKEEQTESDDDELILPQVQATQEIEELKVTLTPVNPDGPTTELVCNHLDSSPTAESNQDTAIMEAILHYTINRPPTPKQWNVAVQLKYDRIREESTSANQQFLDSIDEGMKKIIKEQVKKEVSKITPKIEKLVTDQLESEVLVRYSKQLYKTIVDAYEADKNL
ncbi:hypothetical protein Tco_0200712 [Tanacetum coccineum]